MAYSAPSTISTGDLITASTWNADVVANPIAIYAGAMSVTSQAVGDILYASSTTQFARIAAVATGQVLTSAGTGTVPAWSSNVDLGGTLDVTGATTLDGTLGVVGDVVFNDAGADKDFRVESDDDTHALVVIGSSDCVGIGESDPSAKFVVSGTGGTAGSLAGFDTSAEKIAILQAGGASHTDRKGNVYIYGTNAGSNDSVAFLSGASASSDMLFATRRADGVGAVNLHLSSGGTNINGAGMTFNAETAAANTLDDYEEGTFTPVLTGTTSASGQGYDTQSGIYTKVGDMVFINIYIDLNAKGSISGFLKITGLPFTNAGHAAPLTVSAQQVAALSPRQVTGPVYGSSAFLYLFLQKQSVATSDVQMDVNDINDSSILNFSGCYKV